MKKLLKKYFSNSLNPSELLELSKMLENTKNQKMFKSYVRSHYDLNLALSETDVDEACEQVIKSIKLRKKAPIALNRWFKYAASLILIIGMGYSFYLISKSGSSLDEPSITLKLDNGEIKVIEEGANKEIVNEKGFIVGKQKGSKIDYKNIDKEVENRGEEVLVYNELNVPYGKIFQIDLADGTLVYLNAGTTLKYPIKFLKGKKREVFLEGEAYFEVSEDKAHPFVVNTNEIDIRVLGTKFNINSYEEDKTVNTVLLEGSVEVLNTTEGSKKSDPVLLEPGHMASWNKSNKSLELTKIETEEYVAWTQGVLLFKIRPFSEILRVLERHYDVEITNNYEGLNSQRFFAKFDTETIEQVLVSFQNSEPFIFDINENKITITKSNIN